MSSGSAVAAPHERPGSGQPPIDLSAFDTDGVVRSVGAAGALRSTEADLSRMVRALFDGSLISPDSLQQMLDTAPPRIDYGLGLSTYNTPSGLSYGHNGRTVGHSSSVRHDLEHDLTVVILSNDGAAPTDELATRLLDLVRP